MGHILYIQNGDLYSSGDNQYGQLGIGSIEDTPDTHKVITGIPQYDAIPWVEALVGANHSVAIKEDKSIWMWGSNIEGQMGLPESTKYLTLPNKKDVPINQSKPIDLNIGLYFTIISQTSEKSYCFGTFQNLGSKIVEVNREMVLLYYTDPSGEAFLTVDTGPKTIIARISSGREVFSDWSGDLIPQEFTTFRQLSLGDYFTLYDPFNRERLVYKKVDTYQIDLGCCPVNALCMHRKYRELKSTVPAVYPSIQTFTFTDFIGDKRATVFSAKEQYGTNFVFDSPLAGIDYMGGPYPNKMDPFTLKGMMLATGKKNLLDIILFGGLHFTENPDDEFNLDTPVEKLSAREVFVKGDFPPYFEEVSSYKLLPGDAFNLHTSSPDNPIPINFYDRSAPVYFFRTDEKNQPIKYVTANRFWLYDGFCEPFNTFETNEKLLEIFMSPNSGFFYTVKNEKDPTDPKIIYKTVGWPVDENNRVLIEDLFMTPPYLIRYELSQGKSAFAQNFVDPYIRIKAQESSDPIPTCNGWNNEPAIAPELTEWLYACYVVVDSFAAGGRRYITYNIGTYAKQLIEYFLNEKTDPELTKYFFGFTKIELEELYDAIRNGKPDTSGNTNSPDAIRYEKITGDSFRLLRDIFNTQLQGKIYFDASSGQPLYKLSNGTLSTDGYVKMLNAFESYYMNSVNRGYHYINIPIDRIVCYTYFSRELKITETSSSYEYKPDRQTLIVPYNVTGKILPGAVKISYWVRSSNPDPNKEEIDNIYQQTATFNAESVIYDSKLNITKITLDRPMSVNYLIGCVRVRDSLGRIFCGHQLNLHIYYNNPFSILEALKDETGITI